LYLGTCWTYHPEKQQSAIFDRFTRINYAIMKHFLQLVVIAASLASLSASAQWVWLNKDGRKVFSDRAPSTDIPDKSIIKRPMGTLTTLPNESVELEGAQPAAAKASAAVAAQASTSKPSGIDKELALRKQKAEQADIAKRKTDEDKLNKVKSDNCQRAKLAKANFESGARLSRLNPQGEREFLDDAARANELKRIQSIVDSDCK
jgi:hypothetical protein